MSNSSGELSSSVPTRECKVVVLGQTGVGKTSLVNRFTKDDFREYVESSTGACHAYKNVTVPGIATVRMSLWDTAGQEQYQSMTPLYYRNAAAAVLVYDISNPESFERIRMWVKELQSRAPAGIQIAIAGNKVDMAEEGLRKVTTEAGQEFAIANSIPYFREVSCKTAEGVKDLFDTIAKRIATTTVESSSARTNSKRIRLEQRSYKDDEKKGCPC